MRLGAGDWGPVIGGTCIFELDCSFELDYAPDGRRQAVVLLQFWKLGPCCLHLLAHASIISPEKQYIRGGDAHDCFISSKSDSIQCAFKCRVQLKLKIFLPSWSAIPGKWLRIVQIVREGCFQDKLCSFLSVCRIRNFGDHPAL